MLDWYFVDKQMSESKTYWISTCRPDGRPHSIPIWGVWLNNRFYFGGGELTATRKNLKENPYAVIHAESGVKVAILEGVVSVEEDQERTEAIIKEYKQKYDVDHSPPFLRLDHKLVLAWELDDFANTPTRWKF